MSMFVSSKWQHVALPTCWRASVRTLFYCYLTFLDHRTNISRKVHAPWRVSALGAPNKFQNCHLVKTNMDKTSQHLERTLYCYWSRVNPDWPCTPPPVPEITLDSPHLSWERKKGGGGGLRAQITMQPVETGYGLTHAVHKYVPMVLVMVWSTYLGMVCSPHGE